MTTTRTTPTAEQAAAMADALAALSRRADRLLAQWRRHHGLRPTDVTDYWGDATAIAVEDALAVISGAAEDAALILTD